MDRSNSLSGSRNKRDSQKMSETGKGHEFESDGESALASSKDEEIVNKRAMRHPLYGTGIFTLKTMRLR